MAELARRPGDPLGVALRADGVDLERARCPRRRTSPTEPRPRLTARRAAASPVRIDSSSCRPTLVEQQAVGDDLVAGAEPDEVSDDDLRDVKRAGLAVPHDGRARRHERGQLVELPLRAKLLPDPDPRVRDDDPEEERVAPVAEDEREQTEREKDRVERRERVRPDDRPRSTGSPAARAARAAPQAALPPPPRTGPEVTGTRLTPRPTRAPSIRRLDLAVRLGPSGDLLLALDRLGRDREQLAEPPEPHALGALVEQLLLDLR